MIACILRGVVQLICVASAVGFFLLACLAIEANADLAMLLSFCASWGILFAAGAAGEPKTD